MNEIKREAALLAWKYSRFTDAQSGRERTSEKNHKRIKGKHPNFFLSSLYAFLLFALALKLPLFFISREKFFYTSRTRKSLDYLCTQQMIMRQKRAKDKLLSRAQKIALNYIKFDQRTMRSLCASWYWTDFNESYQQTEEKKTESVL